MPYCPECGKEVKRGVKFCPECGTRIMPTRPPAKPAAPKEKPPSKPAPPKVKPAPAKPRVEGRGWSMGKKVAVFSVIVVAGVIAVVLIYLLSGGGGAGGIITKNPSAMMPTSADLPGWTMGQSVATTAASLSIEFGFQENVILGWGYESGCGLSCSKDGNTLTFMVLKLSSIEGAHEAYSDLCTTENVYSVSLGDEAQGVYRINEYYPYGLDGISFRKTNIYAVTMLRGSAGATVQQWQVLPYAQILAAKIS